MEYTIRFSGNAAALVDLLVEGENLGNRTLAKDGYTESDSDDGVAWTPAEVLGHALLESVLRLGAFLQTVPRSPEVDALIDKGSQIIANFKAESAAFQEKNGGRKLSFVPGVSQV